jgi:hypothetical protein
MNRRHSVPLMHIESLTLGDDGHGGLHTLGSHQLPEAYHDPVADDHQSALTGQSPMIHGYSAGSRSNMCSPARDRVTRSCRRWRLGSGTTLPLRVLRLARP